MKKTLIILVKAYRAVISPLFPPCCRYTPSCSAYSIEAIQEHGVLKGSGLAVKRICRCHPFGSSGYDPVPSKDQACKHHTSNYHTEEKIEC